MTKEASTLKADSLDIVQRYDALMYEASHIRYFLGSDFTNFGYWDADTKDQKQACENLMDRLIALIPERKGKILDVACGKGGTTRHLLKYYTPSSVTAVNLSAKQLETARARAPGCGFVLMDAAHLAFEDATFDDIICVEAAFHFVTRERFLREALRVLKPGGRLVLSDILMTREAEQAKPYRTEENYLENPAAYGELGRSVGFSNVDVIDTTEPCWHGCYWHAVRQGHEKYLSGEVDLAGLKRFLQLTYRRAKDIRHYLLASLRKGA